ncbi:LLM class flavin-dependent oxidoreductase [Ktedonosporobacter rubrisoli]|uniref:LLM class flavin-dependent oxidoreductase n=1 Tax=Ktedonosporobacter rubrisoli TaxID=2509675 RepID=A0A4P6JJF1_KTERU|nr:LLM class flavin-dependent oxidoreductase [Ktedonosporobacter rubrisoli]QBD75228.1 LLM class flavin-dependent oxidoreductase [Ktedonosporobacter rubrisoli]
MNQEQEPAVPHARRQLKIGINLPSTESSMAGKSARWKDLLAFAERVDALGYDSLWVPDHLLIKWQEQIKGTWECWSLLAALAAVTQHVELGTLVACTAFRSPALLAKTADTIDEISGGRLILGLGAGWDGPEYSAFDLKADHRVDRFVEALQIIVPLLRTGRVNFAGKYYRAQDCELRLRGPRPEGPPILIGAKGPRMLGLAATYADLWNAEGPVQQPEELIERQQAGDAACRAAGRDPSSLGRSASIVLKLPMKYGQNGQPEPPTDEQIAELVQTLRNYARAGLTHVQLWLMPNNIAGLEWFAPVLAQLDRDAA